MTRRVTARLAMLALAACGVGLGGCQKGELEDRATIQIDSVDVRLTATDNRAGAVLTADAAPPSGPQTGAGPLTITETVNTTGQSVVPVQVTDDAAPANQYGGGRIVIR